MMKQELTLVFENQSTDRDVAWELMASYLMDHGHAETTYQIGGKDIPFHQIGEVLKQRGKHTFLIYGKTLKISLVIVGFLHDAIRINGSADPEWDGLVNRLQGAGNFVHAFLVDSEYDHWQNAHDPLQYSSHNRSYEGLPMKSNGLPYPLEQQIVDTSKNPGRVVLHEGFIEAIGSPMWLGKRFWELTLANPESLRNLEINIGTAGETTRISLGGPINDATDIEIQKTLRSKLFPHCDQSI